jgi:protein-L-isoaspartate(D-aspartate) O-methyltransferase
MKQFYIGLIFFLVWACHDKNSPKHQESEYRMNRERMVASQLVTRGIKNSGVLKAMNEVPRHLFVPEEEMPYAYLDEPRRIGFNQTISQPYIVAFMTEQLNLSVTDRVLEVGTGSGYQAAILSTLADSVFTIEIIPELALLAADRLKQLGFLNVLVKTGDGYRGWPEKAPFDAIIITAAPPKIPQPLLDQLKLGGKMILPVGEYEQELVLVHKTETGLSMESVLPVRFVPMTGEIQNKNGKTEN